MRCYIPSLKETDGGITLDREASHHLARVLRVQPGDAVELFDGRGGSFSAVVDTASKQGVTVRVKDRHQSPPLRPALILGQALIRAQKMDWILQKATELGASAILPLITERAVARAPEKAERWRRIVAGAAEQCGAHWMPDLLPPTSVAKALADAAGYDLILLAALTDNARPLREIWALPERPNRVLILVGPEGDFTPAEMDAALAAGAIPVSLGPLTLRAETAGLAVLAALTCAWR